MSGYRTHTHTLTYTRRKRGNPSAANRGGGFSDDDGFLPSLGAREVVTSLTPEKNGLYPLPSFFSGASHPRSARQDHSFSRP